MQVVLWCDGNHQGRVQAVREHTVILDHGKPRLFAVCDECDSTIFALAMMMENGSEPEAESLSDMEKIDALICPECGFVSVSRGALGQHLGKQHDKGIRSYKEVP